MNASRMFLGLSTHGDVVVFGYALFLCPDFEGEEYSRIRGLIGRFVRDGGYRLGGVFADKLGGDSPGFHALLGRVRLSGAAVIVVPHFGHLAHVPGLVGASEWMMFRYVRARVVPLRRCRCMSGPAGVPGESRAGAPGRRCEVCRFSICVRDHVAGRERLSPPASGGGVE